MNKKIEDAIETYDKYKCCNPSWVDGFIDGAEWALREAIDICNLSYKKYDEYQHDAHEGILTIKLELEKLLSSEDKNDQT